MTTTHLFPPGYDPSIDRVPPRRVGCRSLVIMLLILFGLIGLCGGLVFFGIGAASASREDTIDETEEVTPEITAYVDAWSATGTALYFITPTDTVQPTPTLDDWEITGTALYFITQSPTITPTFSETPSPTMDYCWFLTPTATPSNTPIPVTPDSWAMTGTHVFLASTTPTVPITPTQPPPRAWCDITPEQTPTPEVTFEVFPTFTWHPEPTQVPYEPPQQNQWFGFNDVPASQMEPQIYVTSEIIYVTQPPQQIEIPIIITATPAPATPNYELTAVWMALTAYAQMTQSVTATPSNTPTDTETATFTPSWTFTYTNTVEPPTATFTPTATATATPTETLEVSP